MGDVKKKRKIDASEVVVGSRSLEAVLLDLAERSVRAEERSARAEERAMIALQTIAAVTRDLQALTLELRTENARFEGRLQALEKGSG